MKTTRLAKAFRAKIATANLSKEDLERISVKFRSARNAYAAANSEALINNVEAGILARGGRRLA